MTSTFTNTRPAKIRDLFADERPRERLLAHGPSPLADADLVAVILGTGTRDADALAFSRELLHSLGGLRGLSRADALALAQLPGLGVARTARLLAAFELGRRAALEPPGSRPRLNTPEAVHDHLAPSLRGLATERLLVLALDAAARPLAPPVALNGGSRAVSARPADIYREPVLLRATSVVLAHNHPSGDPTPSDLDVRFTEHLAAAGGFLDIELVDHLVVGEATFVSLRREGLGFEKGHGR
jgi:DNA repair protein RadC